MRTITISGRKIHMYDAIEELPVDRFQKYNKMLLVDAGVGSTLADFDLHLEKAFYYIRKDNDLALMELENLRNNVYMIMSETSPKHLAFACLVTEIDGEKCDDISETGLKATFEKLNTANNEEILETLESVKKKSKGNWKHIFQIFFRPSKRSSITRL